MTARIDDDRRSHLAFHQVERKRYQHDNHIMKVRITPGERQQQAIGAPDFLTCNAQRHWLSRGQRRT